MHLLRCPVFIKATHQCFLHVDTESNHLADDLSYNKYLPFSSRFPPPSHNQPQFLEAYWIFCSIQKLNGPHRISSILFSAWPSPPQHKKVYTTAMRHSHTFYTTYNVNTRFPFSEHLLCIFVAYQQLAASLTSTSNALLTQVISHYNNYAVCYNYILHYVCSLIVCNNHSSKAPPSRHAHLPSQGNPPTDTYITIVYILLLVPAHIHVTQFWGEIEEAPSHTRRAVRACHPTLG